MTTGYPNAGTGVGSCSLAGLNNVVADKGFATRGEFCPVPNTETLTGAKTIAQGDPWLQQITPGAARDVTMPSTSLVWAYFIVNRATSASHIITVKDSAASTVGTIGPTQSAWVMSDGTTVTISRTSAGTTTFTDNTTGTAGTTLAAGAGCFTLTIPCTFPAGTSAGDVITNYVLGYKFKILAWSFTTDVPGVGAGASRVFNMEIGTTDVGTVPSTITCTEASTSDIGEQTAGTAVSGANTGASTDSFSIEVANGGTAFTAGSGFFTVKIQNLDTADAIASLAARS